MEQSGPLASQTFTASSHGEILTGKSSAENIDGWDTVLTGGSSPWNTARVLVVDRALVRPGLSSIHDRALPRQLVSLVPPACQSKLITCRLPLPSLARSGIASPTLTSGVLFPLTTTGSMDLLHVGVAVNLRPVFLEHGPAVAVDLALPDHPHPGLLKAEIETANPREQ